MMNLVYSAIGSAILGAVAIAASPTLAQSPTNPTSVNPTTDGASQACLTGYPDGSFQGDRPVTRYEFAAGLDACIEQMLAPLQNADLATQDEFEATLQRQRELNEQLRELGGQVNAPSSEPSPTR